MASQQPANSSIECAAPANTLQDPIRMRRSPPASLSCRWMPCGRCSGEIERSLAALPGTLASSEGFAAGQVTPLRLAPLFPHCAGIWTPSRLPAQPACAWSGRLQQRMMACGACTASACTAGQQQQQRRRWQRQEREQEQQLWWHLQHDQGSPQRAQHRVQQLAQHNKQQALAQAAPAAGSSLLPRCGSARRGCCGGAPTA